MHHTVAITNVKVLMLNQNVSYPAIASDQLTFACSKSIIETLEKGVKYISHLFLVFLLLTLNKQMLTGLMQLLGNLRFGLTLKLSRW